MKLLGRAIIGDGSCFGEIEDDRFHVVVGDVLSEHRRNGQSMAIADVPLADVEATWKSPDIPGLRTVLIP